MKNIFIIAEIGINHNGLAYTARELISEAVIEVDSSSCVNL